MAYQYLEVTRRQLAEEVVDNTPKDLSRAERMKLRSSNHNTMGDVTTRLNELGGDGWELVSVLEAKSYGSEIMYTFKRTI